MGSVFISYRREDTEGQARALFQHLVELLGRGNVFMDVDSIGLGRDFREAVRERLATCDLMLVLIGRDWLDSKDKSGRRRLEMEDDFVRLEIAAALKRNITVTPVLLHGTTVPSTEQLPADLKDLAYRNGFELSHNRWDSDVQELIRRLGLVARNDTSPVREADSMPLRAPRSRRPGLIFAGLSVIAIAIGAVGLWILSQMPYQQQEISDPTLPVPNAAADTSKSGAEGGKADPVVGGTRTQPEAPKAPKTEVKNPVSSPPIEKKPDSPPDSGPQVRNRYFDSPDFQLSISSANRYVSSPFTIDELDLSRDFSIGFQIRSTRQGGSTRYGIAWNYAPDDFLLFTIHTLNGSGYSIGPGRSGRYAPFSRFSEGAVTLNGESDFDTLQMTKRGSTLIFAINDREVWRTTYYPLQSNRFAFWAADYSDARIRSYALRQ